MTTLAWHKPLSWAALLVMGCTGSIIDPGTGSRPGGANATPGNTGGTTNNPGTDPDEPPPDPDDLADLDPETFLDGVPAASRVVRLGYDEYDRTISDLLYLDVGKSVLFPLELPALAPYEGLAERSVSERLLTELAGSAAELAEQVVTTPSSFEQVVPCAPPSAECRDQFIDAFGLRSYRWPLTDAERSRLRTLFDRGGELIQSGDAFRDGVQLVLEAVLQSAKFLYRAEQGTGAAGEAGVPLTGHELATRLSYMFWGTMPDAALFEAAAQGSLSTPSGLELEARRLAESPLATSRVHDFHARWIQLDDLALIEKSAAAFPKFSETLVESMRQETLRFVEAVTLEGRGAIVQLLTAPYSFVDAPLADLYGLPGTFGSDLARVDFEPSSGRMGLLTQAAFLSGHSSNSTGTSPILRGVFVLKRLGCEDIPAPPPGAELMEPAGERPELTTTRQFFTWKTSMQGCAGCHSLINPTGFAFEQFDGIGQFRSTENGAPVETSGVLNIAGRAIEFETAAELVAGLAEVGRVRSCYAQHWLRYFYGRADTAADGRTLARMTQQMATSGYGARDLMVAMTQGAAFTHLPQIAE